MYKVLVIAPRSDWNELAQQSLILQTFECDTATNGKDAQLKAYKTKYDYIFLDLSTTDHSGLMVFKYLRTTSVTSQVFLFAPNDDWMIEHRINQEVLLKMGAVKIMVGPAHDSLGDHIRSLGKIKAWETIKPTETAKHETGSESVMEDSKFTRLKIDDFFEDVLAVTDFYIRLGANRYIKIFHKGSQTSSVQLKKYALAGQKYIYFPSSDRTVYVSFQNEIAKQAIATSNNPGAVVIKAIKSASEKLHEELKDSGIQPHLLEEGKQICQNMYNMAMKDNNLKNILNDFEKFKPSSYSDAFLVSFFSTVICKNIEWVGTKTIETLALGALLHDIGTIQIEDIILKTAYEDLTPQQKSIFNNHPNLGVNAIKSMRMITPGVCSIVHQHHEYNDGSGFPSGLTGNKIFPLAKIVALADGLTDFLKEHDLSALDGLKEFLSDRQTLMRYEPELVRNLIKGFKG
jgi:response regulator RpfG family c-di-GMP phosphodiesterase